MWIRRVSQAAIVLAILGLAAPSLYDSRAATKSDPDVEIVIKDRKYVPIELNPDGGGAPRATFKQAAAFAWQEFIALNWPARPQHGVRGDRDMPHSNAFWSFGNDQSLACGGPLVWETMRSKVETFPGNNLPPGGYQFGAASDYGYDLVPVYNYADGVVDGPCQGQSFEAAPWINLDETDQITLNNMYAGVVEGSSAQNSQPKLIRFLAKSNRTQYRYVAKNGWWNVIPSSVTQATRSYLTTNKMSPPPETAGLVSQPYGTIEVKAGWRQLNPDEASSGRFHMQKVRYYEKGRSDFSVCWRDAMWGLVSLHIIQKTQSAPYFIYATFEQADNIQTPNGRSVEDEDGTVRLPQGTLTSPLVCLNDRQPHGTYASPSKQGAVIQTPDPASCTAASQLYYCNSPGKRIYYRNVKPPPPDENQANSEPYDGDICVNQRVNSIPEDIVRENGLAHRAMREFGITPNSAPWLAYKLVNVQYYPYDKIPNSAPNGSPYTFNGPYDAQHPSPASYYLANIVVETNRSLQQFSGGLSPNIATDWDGNGERHKNTYYNGTFYNMGGCMGCHGSQGQSPGTNPPGDFSVILSRGGVITPEIPAVETAAAVKDVKRNRSLSP